MDALRGPVALLTVALALSAAAVAGEAQTQEAAAGAGVGAAYCVSVHGDDRNPGTEESPWRTIQRGVSALAPGDTLLICQGVYQEGVFLSASGEEGRPIRIEGYPGQRPVIDASGLEHAWGVFQMHNSNHVLVSGIEIRDATRGQAGFVAYGCTDVTIRDCRTFNTGASGILVWACRNVLVEGNEVEAACQQGGEESVTVKFDSDSVQVRGNHIHHTGHEGVDVKEGARNVQVHGNHIHHVERQALYADAWDRETYSIEFSANVIHDCGFGIAVCSEMGGVLHDVVIANNVIYNNRGPGMVFAGWRAADVCPLRSISFVNNTVHNNGYGWGGGVSFENGEATDVVVRNNILSANARQIAADKWPLSAAVDHNLIFGKTDAEGEGAVIGDPAFVDPSAGDFRVRSGSAAIDAGSADGAPADDVNGDRRPCGMAHDIGAHEQCPPRSDSAETGE